MPAWIKLFAVLSIGCTGAETPDDTNRSDDSSSDSGSSSNVDIEVGFFSLQGEVLDAYTWTRTGGGLCLSAADAGAIVRGESLAPTEPVVVSEAGTWLLEDVSSTATAGIYLLLDDYAEPNL